jgi:hypothetical protein
MSANSRFSFNKLNSERAAPHPGRFFPARSPFPPSPLFDEPQAVEILPEALRPDPVPSPRKAARSPQRAEAAVAISPADRPIGPANRRLGPSAGGAEEWPSLILARLVGAVRGRGGGAD